MKRVLVVEDENSIREMEVLNLRMAGWEVLEAPSAERALELLHQNPPCDARAARYHAARHGRPFRCAKQSAVTTPTSASSLCRPKVRRRIRSAGFPSGRTNYITKPFSVSELIARIEALARRVHRNAGEGRDGTPDQLVSGSFVLDEKSRVLYKAGKPIDLTQVEFQIMELFFRNPGTALVREKILEGVWGSGYYGDVKIVDVNIRRLRMKIEDEPSSPTHILTVWGYGYRWNP